VTFATSDVGPINYELFVLVWPYNDRNQWLGIQDTVWYSELQGTGEIIKPSVASAWELKDDGIQLKIRQDVPWHDPSLGKLTVDDVLHSWDRATAEGTKWTRAEEFRTNYKVAEVKALDVETIFLPWNKRNLKWYTIPRDVTLQSKKLFDSKGADYVNVNAMGTGPFKVKEQVSDDHFYLEAVIPHWRETPKIAEFQIVEVPEEATRIAMLKTGEADSIQFGIQNMKEIKAISGVKTWSGPSLGKGGFQIAPTGQYHQKADETGKATNRVPLVALPWVGDPSIQGDMDKARNVRMAMAMAIDRKAIIDGFLGGVGEEHYLWNMGPGHPRWTDEMTRKWAIPFDRDGARKLLAEAGYANGFEFNYFIPSGLSSTLEEVGEGIIPMWEAVGLKPKVQKAAYTAMRPKMLSREMDTVWIWIETGWNLSPINILYRFSTRAVWNVGVEYEEVLGFEDRIFGATDEEAAWKVVIEEWLSWFHKNLPTFQTVAFEAPVIWGPRIKSWNQRWQDGRWGRDPQLIELN
jgi:peptide/nickel transport system substrate-binding protein